MVADLGYDRAGSYLTGPGRSWLARLDLPAAAREIVTGCLAVIDGLAPLADRIDAEVRQHARVGPRVKMLTMAHRSRRTVVPVYGRLRHGRWLLLQLLGLRH